MEGGTLKEIDKIKEEAEKMLLKNPDSAVRYLLLRDVISEPDQSSRLIDARESLYNSICVRQLSEEQLSYGSWGPFHSRNSKSKSKIPSTEIGVSRGLALGLDSSHYILHAAESYISAILEDKIPFPDYQEKNDRWTTGVNLFLCSTLSSINPEHLALINTRSLWLDILQRTFNSGSYNENDEIFAHKELTGATIKGSYLVIKSKYHLMLLGSKKGYIPGDLEKRYIKWIWELDGGIGYIGVRLFENPPLNKPGIVNRWFLSHELLSRFYPCIWSALAYDQIRWIWNNQKKEFLWDFGQKAPSQYYFPLSDSWKYRNNRQTDWTVRVLIILRRYYEAVYNSKV
jgi:hypothetical protein